MSNTEKENAGSEADDKPAKVDRFRPLRNFLVGLLTAQTLGSVLVGAYWLTNGGMPIGQMTNLASVAGPVLGAGLAVGAGLLLLWMAPTGVMMVVVSGPNVSNLLCRVVLKYDPVAESEVAKRGSIWSGRDASLASRFTLLMMFPALVILCSGAFLGRGAEASSTATSTQWVDSIWVTGGLVVVLGCWLLSVFCLWRSRTPMVVSPVGDVVGEAKSDGTHCSCCGQRNPKAKSADRWKVIVLLFICVFFSLIALVSLWPFLLLFLRSQEHVDSGLSAAFLFSCGVLLIGACGAFANGISLNALLRHQLSGESPWRVILTAHSGALLLIVAQLGMAAPLLKMIMNLTSIRIEEATLVLEPDGCDLLKALRVSGWTPSASKDSKRCLLHGVTVESSLEPAMQISCHRKSAQSTANGQGSQNASGGEAQVRLQSFTIPSKYVSDVVKTAGHGKQLDARVCQGWSGSK